MFSFLLETTENLLEAMLVARKGSIFSQWLTLKFKNNANNVFFFLPEFFFREYFRVLVSFFLNEFFCVNVCFFMFFLYLILRIFTWYFFTSVAFTTVVTSFCHFLVTSVLGDGYKKSPDICILPTLLQFVESKEVIFLRFSKTIFFHHICKMCFF